ncbi:aminotransferase class III-fold pyridoxal phosphate-dependent enzyme [Paraburkholderia sp. D15]|uniref:aminotransferase class III-fold pyridoxal phosphate-dependent enzyme n=1 Tax=Paraburkholderia sp. D15 TaxID=2880218 RepID=UPI002479F6D1|nr:aminotransferase class III-fold pyridoxal phosphate-dependent enzyme [Paraburkholderia sp. D15]WGS49841.1 aminotransferase class III-fold pyridoxal phosphate-dependent enzyme [Paraburkholderia sp. D15]
MTFKTEQEILAWLAAYAKVHFNSSWDGCTPVSLADLGIDSISGAELICEFERWLGISIPVNFVESISDTTALSRALVEWQMSGNAKNNLASRFEIYVNPYQARKLAQLKLDRTFVRANGPYLYDEDGRRYLDFLAQYGALPFGHHPDEIWAAVDSLRDDAEPNFAQPSLLASAGWLAQRLVELAPASLRYVTFSNSGAEAIEAALKMARHATGRTRILSTLEGFHGKTFGALSATGKPDYQTPFGLPLAGFDYVEYGNAAALEKQLASSVGRYAAFIVEPIQGEGGVHVPAAGYLADVQTLCRRHGVLLIVDEIQTGLGRTGALFACEDEDVQPDILTVSKALGGGLVPIGATLCSEAVYRQKFALKHSSTFAGNAIGARVGLATLNLLTRNDGELLRHVRLQGAYLRGRLEALREKHPSLISEVRGRGFMLGVRFSSSRAAWPESFLGIAAEEKELAQLVASYLLNVEGVRVAPTLNRGEVLRLQPPLNATREQCDIMADALGRALDALAERHTGNFYRAIVRGEPSAPESGAQRSVTPPVATTVYATASPTDAHSFGFLLHPLDPDSYADYDPSLRVLRPDELAEFARSMDGLLDPVIGSTVTIESPTGAIACGEFIMLSHTAEQLRALAQGDAIAVLNKGIELARQRGARIVGLGAYTSVVSGGGAQLLDRGVALTSGNSYTVATGVEALDAAMRRAGREWHGREVSVVGAAGAIGSCMALLLARRASRLTLIGNPAHEPRTGRARLLRVAGEIVRNALLVDDDVVHAASVAAQVRRSVSHGASIEQAIEQLEDCGALVLTSDLREIGTADVVVTATSFPGQHMKAGLFRQGAMVCDISRPRSVHASIVDVRPDVLVIDGGIIALPGAPRIGPYGVAAGTSYACMAETMLLALEGRFENTSIGHDLDIAEIERQQVMARKHGFAIAALQSFGSPLAQARWQRFIESDTSCSLPADPCIGDLDQARESA